jgi:hypothetical protein
LEASLTGKELTLECPCGAVIKGEGEEDLVEKARRHLREVHPERADYSRDEILFMAH